MKKKIQNQKMNLDELKQEKFEQQEIQKQILQLENLSKNLLSQQSWERYINIKIADQEKSMNILGAIANAIKQGVQKISDEEFIKLLKSLEQKKKTKIKFMRK